MSKLPADMPLHVPDVTDVASAAEAVDQLRRGLAWMYRSLLQEHNRGIGARFFAKLGNGSAVGGATAQWTYPFDEVIQTANGYGGWTLRPNGRSGTARNLAEELDSAGTEAPENLIVVMYTSQVVRGGTWAYWFHYEGAL